MNYKHIKLHSLVLPFLLWPLRPIHCRCRGVLLHLIILNDKHTLGRPPVDEGSVRRIDLYQTTQNTHNRQNILKLGRGIALLFPGPRH